MNKQMQTQETKESFLQDSEFAEIYGLNERSEPVSHSSISDPLTELVINVQVLEEMVARLHFLQREARYLLKVD